MQGRGGGHNFEVKKNSGAIWKCLLLEKKCKTLLSMALFLLYGNCLSLYGFANFGKGTLAGSKYNNKILIVQIRGPCTRLWCIFCLPDSQQALLKHEHMTQKTQSQCLFDAFPIYFNGKVCCWCAF